MPGRQLGDMHPTFSRRLLLAPLVVAVAACEPTVTAEGNLLPDPFGLEEGSFAAAVSGEVELEAAGTASFEAHPFSEEMDHVALRAGEWEPSWQAPSLDFIPTAILRGGPVFPFEAGTHRLGLIRPVYASLALYVDGQLHIYLSDGGTLTVAHPPPISTPSPESSTPSPRQLHLAGASRNGVWNSYPLWVGARSRWARLLARIYEVFPLAWPIPLTRTI